MHNKLPIVLAVVLTASILLISSSVYAADSTSSATVLNAAPTVGVGLTPDDDPAAGVQVINPDWQTQNRTVTISATVTDMNGWDDLTGTVTAEITGPSTVDDSPVNLTFDYEINITTVVYTGIFNMSAHAEGDYTVNVTADDAGGLSCSGQENFTYLHTAGDITPPTVTDPAADPDSITADAAEESELSVNVTDASGIFAVTIDLSPIGGDSAQLMNNTAGTDTYTTTTTAAVGTTAGMYGLPVTATDDSPNRNTNTDVSILLTVLPNEVVATYDFTTGAGMNRWAYKPQVGAKPPAANDVPDIEFENLSNPKKNQYVKISTDDRKMQSDSTDAIGNYAAHRFKFDIADKIPAENIVKIGVLWNGKGTHTDRKKPGATLYIWNDTSSVYEELDITVGKDEVYLTGEITVECANYIDVTGNLTILVEQNYNQTMDRKKKFVSKLSTDFVKVDITHLSLPASTSFSTSTAAVSEASTAEGTGNHWLERVQQGGSSLLRWLFGG